MGLLDRLMGKQGRAASGVAPVRVEAIPGAVCAPVAGRVCALSDVPDPVFGSGAMGGGCGVWPEGEVVFAPASGTVSVTMPHAVGISCDDGCEVLVHVGIDTVEMRGDGFTGLVAQGERVVAGQPVLRFSREKIAGAGHPDVVVLVVTNSSDLSGVELAAAAGQSVAAGAVLIRVTK